MATQTKRQNFNITAEEEAELGWLRDAIRAPTMKDTILRAVRVLAILARELKKGHSLYVGSASGKLTEVIIPELQAVRPDEWKYLIARPHPWRRQLYVKGRRLPASRVWTDMLVNQMTPEEAADNWDLPMEAIEEIIRYCESHRHLLGMEADEEKRRLRAKGIQLEPPPAGR